MITDDKRFAAMHTAPVFAKSSAKKRKSDTWLHDGGDKSTKPDDRFQAAKLDPRFTEGSAAKVDKYGRKVKVQKQETGGDKGKAEQKGSIEDRLDYLTRLSRGEIDVSSSSSSEDDDSNDDGESSDDSDSDGESTNSDSEDVEGPLAIPGDENAAEETPVGEATSRFAIQNCDWENLSAEDIL